MQITHNGHLKEIISLTSQLAYTYSANRRSLRPFGTILFTSLNARTLTRMDAVNDASYKRWSNTEWWEESYEGLWSNGQVDNTVVEGGKERMRIKASKESVIYLTADSEHELLELREGETYIIGGICDHNRYKVSHCTCHPGSRVYQLQCPESMSEQGGTRRNPHS